MRRSPGIAGAIVTVILAAGCGPAVPAATAPLGATSHEEFVTAACLAFDELDAAIGNPDTGTGSKLSDALDAAVESGDVARASQLADESIARLEEGRRQLAIAGGWEPGREMATAADTFFLASEVLVNGKRAGAATRDLQAGQTAFEKAGGLAAWQGMIEAAGSIELPAGSAPIRCPNVAIQL
ncbi:MAG TPA: hypothetical protein VFV72_09175 [Candidatus Limnocylindrales bacterium]|nr:hypothetical protein [Candidatus Limnocylindrales bacterium]